MIPVKVKKLHPNAVMPEYQTPEAACFDLVVTEIEQKTDNKAVIKFGLAMEIPKGYKLVLVPRSSFTSTHWVQSNSPGQIDSDYRGELQMRIVAIPGGIEEGQTTGLVMNTYSLVHYPLPFKVGDRAAQCFIEKVIQASFEEVEELSETQRGSGGFGSTGK